MPLDLKKLESVSGSKVTLSNNFHGIRDMNRDVNNLYIETVIKRMILNLWQLEKNSTL